VALAAGFLTLTLSSWHSIASFGLVATVAIVLALVATLVVLPPLQLMAASLRLGSVRSG
jgi:predicted RND superfamily exporter protein